MDNEQTIFQIIIYPLLSSSFHLRYLDICVSKCKWLEILLSTAIVLVKHCVVYVPILFCTSFQLSPDAIEPMVDASTSVSLVLTDGITVSVEKVIEYEMMAELVNVRSDINSRVLSFCLLYMPCRQSDSKYWLRNR